MRSSLSQMAMEIAYAASRRSRDASTKVGACILGADRRVKGTGYNGPPAGSPGGVTMTGPDRHLFVIHAEVNALFQTQGADLTGASLYSTHRPCSKCCLLIFHAGIRTVFYAVDQLSAQQVQEAREVQLALGLWPQRWQTDSGL